MEFAIIAAGAGSRLKEDGLVDIPKPLVPLNGIPMIERLIRLFAANDASGIHIIANPSAAKLIDYLDSADFGVPIYLYVEDTESSLHSLHHLVQQNPSWDACVISTTDTVFSGSDLSSYINCFRQGKADAYMALTQYVEDESPLFVGMDEMGIITSFTDGKNADTDFISGGIYGLRRQALDVVFNCVDEGVQRMRGFQRELLKRDLLIMGHCFGKIIDVDRPADRAAAESYLSELEKH